MPFALRKLTERIMKKAQQQGSYTYGQPFGQSNPFGDQYQDNSGKRDSRVKVDYVPQQEEKRKGTATAGEFIDFEEIK